MTPAPMSSFASTDELARWSEISWREQMLAKLKISPRLAIAVAVPLAMLIVLAGYDLSVKWAARVEMGRIGPLAVAVARIGQLVHELQRERGASSVFLASKGAQMRDELPGLRKRTDEQRPRAMAALAQLQMTAAGELRDAIAKAQAGLDALDARRSEIDALTMPTPNLFAYFTETITKLLAVTSEIAKVSGQGDVAM